MEIVGLLIGALGLVLAFEEPRHRIVRIFRRDSDISSKNRANTIETKSVDQTTVQIEASRTGLMNTLTPIGSVNTLGHGVLGSEEKYVLSFATCPGGITMTETREKFAASQERIEQALEKLESMELIVITCRHGELHWKVSDFGKQFLKDNPYALYLN